MRPFTYERPTDLAEALRLGVQPGAAYLGGGTNLIDLAKLDVMRPATVVDLGGLDAFRAIEAGPAGLRLGGLVSMADASEHPAVMAGYPVIAESLQMAASQQLRNMAGLGGNLLQRTRCGYFRDTSWAACNKREPGSGCAALGGVNRGHAVLGTSEACIATYPGDFAQALVALDAQVELVGPEGTRTLAVEDLHRLPGDTPHLETNLQPGEIVAAVLVPAGPWARRSRYVKVRDRASFASAAASAAVALDLDGGVVRTARIALGGVTTKPWRAREAEAALTGQPLTEANARVAADAAFDGAVTRGGNDGKPELGRRTLIRALLETARMEG